MNEMNWRDVKIDRRENKGSTFWYLGSGELPRFGREHNQTVFYSRDLGTVGEENEKDEFIVPLMSISGIFDSPLSDEQLVAYFQAREQSYINLLVLEAKKKFPKLKNEDFESYVVVRQDPLVFEDRFAYEEVCIFICVDKKIKTSKKMDLYEISKSYDIVASWEKDFRNIANGKLDPKKIKWNHRADTVLRVENSVGQMINELYDRADKKSRLSQ